MDVDCIVVVCVCEFGFDFVYGKLFDEVLKAGVVIGCVVVVCEVDGD